MFSGLLALNYRGYLLAGGSSRSFDIEPSQSEQNVSIDLGSQILAKTVS
ncbi:hypothetical protein SAMN04488011_102177 [Palleronia pelagia]|uniref:Uncharacterized protein n=1 Tax=Palleronia pelagia TaxID=387096 RepID=A0A1H8D2P3_9RHOB|nr:hypothetical protein SAMN04488011_102177 [Palleronia pelagia]